MSTIDDPPLIHWGRCRSGTRWYWYAQITGGDSKDGWAAHQVEATRRGNAAAVKLAAGRYAVIRINDEAAEARAEAATAAKQAKAKAEHEQRTADGNHPVELYAIEPGYYDYGARRWVHSKIVRLPVVKKTAHRIYYLRSSEPDEYETGYIDRQEFEAIGCVHSSRYGLISAQRPELPPETPFVPPKHTTHYYRPSAPPPDLKQLKAAMAAAHPDHGGTSEAFIAARERYVAAKRLAGLR